MDERLTNCECTQPGWCERHHCEKNRHLFEMCRRLKAWFRLWEQGEGPGQQRSPTAYPASRGPCLHRGEEFRTEECPTCGGNVRVKIFSCQVHQECSLSSRLTAIKNCLDCADFETV
ncbi:MAG: hypothetical protein JWM11_1883 [Planctomycetaceae bacterium]|nr:hypothetical protein [Planctomycetaceae bacterium]